MRKTRFVQFHFVFYFPCFFFIIITCVWRVLEASRVSDCNVCFALDFMPPPLNIHTLLIIFVFVERAARPEYFRISQCTSFSPRWTVCTRGYRRNSRKYISHIWEYTMYQVHHTKSFRTTMFAWRTRRNSKSLNRNVGPLQHDNNDIIISLQYYTRSSVILVNSRVTESPRRREYASILTLYTALQLPVSRSQHRWRVCDNNAI